jgi:hypothetical protein
VQRKSKIFHNSFQREYYVGCWWLQLSKANKSQILLFSCVFLLVLQSRSRLLIRGDAGLVFECQMAIAASNVAALYRCVTVLSLCCRTVRNRCVSLNNNCASAFFLPGKSISFVKSRFGCVSAAFGRRLITLSFVNILLWAIYATHTSLFI